jgi:hypothetical protein
MDPKGPIQSILAFAFEALDNPKEVGGKFVTQSRPDLLPVLPKGIDLTLEGGNKLSGEIEWSGDPNGYETMLSGPLSTKLHEEFPGVTHQFARDTHGMEMSVLGKKLPTDNVGAAVSMLEQALDDVPETDRPSTMLCLSKLMTQEMFAPLLVEAGRLTNESGEPTRFVMRGDVGQAMNSTISLKRDDSGEGYVITYKQNAPLKALTFGTEMLNLDNGHQNSVEMEVSIRVSNEDLRNGSTAFKVVDGPKFDLSLQIDPNNYRL